MTIDSRREATSSSRRASAMTRRAAREAQEAHDFYQHAARTRREAAKLTQQPYLWVGDYNPATLEDRARSWQRVGDTYLRSSFRSTAQAAFYRDLAARYRAIAARAALRAAEIGA